jgi:hypothetical protein
MKKTAIIIVLTLILSPMFLQETKALDQEKDNPEKNKDENTEVELGNELLKINKGDSSLNIRVKDRGVSILESLEGQRVKVEKYPDMENIEESEDSTDTAYENVSENELDCLRNYRRTGDNEDTRGSHERRRNKFKGNWSGVEFGFNNYTTSGENIVIPDDISYMTLHSGRSHNFNINFAQLNLGITRHAGFVTGLGLNWNNYKFDGNNNIAKGVNGVIEMLDPGVKLEKSKLATLYLTLPFLLELQLPVNSNHLNIAAGPIGAVKLSSHSKMVYEGGQKVKSNSDYSLNMLRYGATARAGFANFQIYGTYYVTPLFQKGKSPGNYNLYPFEIGLAFTFND